MRPVTRRLAKNGGYDHRVVAGAKLTWRYGADRRVDAGPEAHFDLRPGSGGARAYLFGAEIFSRGSGSAYHAARVPVGNLFFESAISCYGWRDSGCGAEAGMSPIEMVELTIDGRKLSVAAGTSV